MPVTKEEVLRALSVVKDPDLGRDLVTLGMIENVKIDENGNVDFTIVLTTPACPVNVQAEKPLMNDERPAASQWMRLLPLK